MWVVPWTCLAVSGLGTDISGLRCGPPSRHCFGGQGLRLAMSTPAAGLVLLGTCGPHSVPEMAAGMSGVPRADADDSSHPNARASIPSPGVLVEADELAAAMPVQVSPELALVMAQTPPCWALEWSLEAFQPSSKYAAEIPRASRSWQPCCIVNVGARDPASFGERRTAITCNHLDASATGTGVEVGSSAR